MGVFLGRGCVNPEVSMPAVGIAAFVLSSMVGWASKSPTMTTMDEIYCGLCDERPFAMSLLDVVVHKKKAAGDEKNSDDVLCYAKRLCGNTKWRLVAYPLIAGVIGAFLSDLLHHPENILQAVGGVSVTAPIFTRLIADHRFARKLLKNEWIACDPGAPPKTQAAAVTALDHV